MNVRLTAAANYPESQLLRALLESNDIPCVIQAESQSTTLGTEAGFQDIVVLVPEAHLERAQALLAANIVKEAPVADGVIPEGAVCPVHELPAQAICSHCGTYMCQRCEPSASPAMCESCLERDGDGGAQQRRRNRKVVALVLLAIFLGIPPLLAMAFSSLNRMLNR
jgi:Putative prokaryotic signal transducing protein